MKIIHGDDTVFIVGNDFKLNYANEVYFIKQDIYDLFSRFFDEHEAAFALLFCKDVNNNFPYYELDWHNRLVKFICTLYPNQLTGWTRTEISNALSAVETEFKE